MFPTPADSVKSHIVRQAHYRLLSRFIKLMLRKRALIETIADQEFTCLGQ
jgi:hypothetical protein